MKQMYIAEEKQVKVDFERPGMPYTASVLNPVIFEEAGKYCCVLGPDLENGIVGFGNTPEMSVQDWDTELTDRLDQPGADDEVATFVHDELEKFKADNRQQMEPRTGARAKANSILTDVQPPQRKLDVTTEGTPSRKNTTDQSNADGSEFR